jgi:hypothetical protein
MTTLSKIPKSGERGTHVETLQQTLTSLGFSTNGVDGIFGGGTASAITKFQQSKGLPRTGVLDSQTLEQLDLTIKPGIDDNPETAIIDIIDRSTIATTQWANRGRAVWGYYHGMALMFAALYTRLKKGDPIVQAMARPLAANGPDALLKFDDYFKAIGLLNNGPNDEDRLRHLFVLMMGLGVMESNGKYSEGIDKKRNNDEGETTEAGLFQTSYNVRHSVGNPAKSLLAQIFTRYSATDRPKGFVSYFAKGFEYNQTKDYGTGDAQAFQRLSKDCPAFTVEYTAVALRSVTNHWAPVKLKGDPKEELQIKMEVNEILRRVQAYVDQYGFTSTEIDLSINDTIAPVVPAVNDAPITTDDAKEAALQNAQQIGQMKQLKHLFDRYPDSKANYWAVVDFNKSSNDERLFIFDLKGGTVQSYLVAHGKNSGEEYAVKFSNESGSNKSSWGIYQTAETYPGKHGRSLRIDGKEPSNSNARARAIVIHSADYVVPNYGGSGRAGRSEGCFAVNPKYITEVIDNLRGGSYLIAWHHDFE